MINALQPETLIQMLNALPVRIFWKDRDSRFLGCNQLFAEDAGVPNPYEFIGRSDYYFYHPDQAAAFRRDDAEVMAVGAPRLRIEEQLTHSNGEQLWIETSKLPLRDDRGQVIGVVGFYVDVTARKLAEAGVCASTAA